MAKYQYETSPRKIKTNYEPVKNKKAKSEPKKVNKIKNKKKSALEKIKMIFLVIIGFTAFFAISYRNAVIDAKFAEIKTLKSDLAVIQKENQQLEANVESCLNLKTLQEEAEKKLGMKALSTDQIEYVNLPKTDYVEPSVEIKEEEENIIVKIFNIIKKFIK